MQVCSFAALRGHFFHGGLTFTLFIYSLYIGGGRVSLVSLTSAPKTCSRECLIWKGHPGDPKGLGVVHLDHVMLPPELRIQHSIIFSKKSHWIFQRIAGWIHLIPFYIYILYYIYVPFTSLLHPHYTCTSFLSLRSWYPTVPLGSCHVNLETTFIPFQPLMTVMTLVHHSWRLVPMNTKYGWPKFPYKGGSPFVFVWLTTPFTKVKLHQSIINPRRPQW